MKSLRPIILTLLCLFFLITSCSSDDDGIFFSDVELEINESKKSYSSIENDICDLVNEHRDSIGLLKLARIEIISTVAKGHTDYMVDTGNVGHDNFAIRSQYLIDNAKAENVGENVAYGFSTAKSVINAWLKSPEHKEILENTKFTHFGISVEKNTDGRNYFTHIFIKK